MNIPELKFPEQAATHLSQCSKRTFAPETSASSVVLLLAGFEEASCSTTLRDANWRLLCRTDGASHFKQVLSVLAFFGASSLRSLPFVNRSKSEVIDRR